MIKTIGKDTYNICQKKSNSDIKVMYKLIYNTWKKIYEGDFYNLESFIRKLKVNADKCTYRNMISEMCGTSYNAAKKDMGL